MRVSVIGGSKISDEQYRQARTVGRLLAKADHEVVCGGLTGVMEAVCRGANDEGGHTIGILPGERRAAANDYIDTVVATGLGNARNVLVVMNGAAVIAIDGKAGTLSELGHALDMGRPVAGLGTHELDELDGIEHVDSPKAAVEHVESTV
ncbi:TIGR00725 family protein [Haloarcula amylovorans]|uniref:TIGR00725 family protein n=1 Tax=Haloarcula amylovorans TaxID=2562280 RepID=UPI00107655A3|nr:TIGR00725 family protein [Halomicroarcula amylolytica]